MINMRSLLLLATLLCLLCVTEVHTQDNPDTMRLCGRAFVRAVVFTCGGSRWRRTMGEEDTLPGRGSEIKLVDRHWRDQNQALISMCCEKGCHRNDLSMLC